MFSATSFPGGSWAKLLRGPRLERRAALVLVLLAVLAGIATYAATALAPDGSRIETVLVLLNIDLIILLLLGIVIVRRLAQLVAERKQGRAGSLLHVRLVVLFGLLAATPAVAVTLFSFVFLTSGLNQWFSSRVSSALDTSLIVAQAYLDEHREVIRSDALAMAADLAREDPTLVANRDYLRHLIVSQAALRSLSEAVVFTTDGTVLARSGLGLAEDTQELSQEVLERAARGEVVTLTSSADDRIRALLILAVPGEPMLLVGRFVDPQVLNFVERTREAVNDYRQLQSERSGIQLTSALIFVVVALLLLLAASWVGINVADRLATPIARLIGAADRVRQGDLTARVPVKGAPDEIGLLARAFNRMAGQLDSQRRELVATNQQLEERRSFTEAVLAGVSAGIVGLDAERRVRLPNRHAIDLLAPAGGPIDGVAIDALLPEIAGLFDRVAPNGDQVAHEQIVVHRGDRKRVLFAHLGLQADEERVLGYVLTFEDVTELLSAQRAAAWSEVARRIAHEIKNPLTPIRLSAERLNRRFLPQVKAGEREGFERAVQTIIRQVDTIGGLVSEFSAFARMPRPTIRFEPLGELLRGAVMLQQTAYPNIRFSVSAPANDPLVIACDAEQVGQVMTNILLNAAHALEEMAPRSAQARIEIVARRDLAWVAVEVADNGPGFPSEPLGRLFEPYFTTRAKGTGLGLAIVKKIMEEHQGRVELDGRPEGGALVRLSFPVGGAEISVTRGNENPPGTARQEPLGQAPAARVG